MRTYSKMHVLNNKHVVHRHKCVKEASHCCCFQLLTVCNSKISLTIIDNVKFKLHSHRFTFIHPIYTTDFLNIEYNSLKVCMYCSVLYYAHNISIILVLTFLFVSSTLLLQFKMWTEFASTICLLLSVGWYI